MFQKMNRTFDSKCFSLGFDGKAGEAICCPIKANYSEYYSCKDHCFASGEETPEIDWAKLDETPDGKVGFGVLLEMLILAYCFVGLGLVCDNHLCPALETLCVKYSIREDVAGATFMALGSAAPELVINLIAVVRAMESEDPEAIQLGVSAVLGSGLVSFLLSTGVCAFYADSDLILKRRPLLREIGSYSVMLICLGIFFNDGLIELWEALTLVGLYVVYLVIVTVSPGIRQAWRVKVQGKSLRRRVSFVHKKMALGDDEDDELLGADEEEVSVEGSRKIQMMAIGADAEPEEGGSEDGEEEDEEEEEEEEEEQLPPWLHFSSYPLQVLFEWTCPDAAEGAKYEKWYAFTVMMSFIWIAFFSFILSTLISRWSTILGIPTIILGATLVAMGGEVPDTIQSIAVAKRGYGALAIANCLGSKVANIGLGLGAAWTLSAALGSPVRVCNAHELQTLVYFHTGAIVLFFFLTLVDAWISCKQKATLGRSKGAVLLMAYPIIVGGFILFHYFGNSTLQ
jgi:Ca2+/Na+ antiporter